MPTAPSKRSIVHATSFLYYILLFRILNLADMGEISLLTATIAIFTTPTQPALPVAATRFISSSLGAQDHNVENLVTRPRTRGKPSPIQL